MPKDFREKFNAVYNNLNEQQRRAVDTIEGPVMVIAGPGTGKTQILSARIGKILLDTDTLPENILCLTYTDAGTVAMRKRLLSFIGSDAYKVHIHTFHSFCNDVIQDNLSLFEKTSLDPISDLERTELFKKLIDAFPKNHPLKRYRGDVYFEINNLQQLFSNMKREGWSPEFINQKIDEYINDLPNRDEYIAKRAVKEFKKGDVRTDKIAEEKEKMEKLRAAVNEFDKFQQLMRRNNRYDFDDMIIWVLKAFAENENQHAGQAGLLRRYQEQYLYILVDEYQDTSGTQNKLVELLINYWDKPNVFVVGDDDQSIYRFQGANIENMELFAESYAKDLLTVVLTNNYRSTQPILNASKIIIDKNEERLVKKIKGLSKELVAANTKINSISKHPVIKEYETQKQEMAGIVLEAEKLIQQGIPAGSIGIIYKENKYGEELSQFFKLKNIPVYSKRSINIFDIPLAQKIILLFKYIAAEHDIPYGGDEMLFEILHFNWFNIPPIEIAKLSVEVAERQFGENKTSLRKLLFDKANAPAKDLFSLPFNEQLKKASAVIEQLIADAVNVTVQTLLEHILKNTGLLTHTINSSDKHYQLQIITAVFDFVKEETRRNPSLQLQALVNTIELMQKEGIALPFVQISGSDKGVNLLTAHGSKGLEFKYVFFAGCNSNNWEKKRKPGGGYSFPDTMFVSQPKQKDEEELRRLFYVAITRAETDLAISYCRFKDDGKELEPSMFIAELIQEQDLKTEKVFFDIEALTDFQLLILNNNTNPEIEKTEEDLISRLLEKFTMNVTALNNYLKCPLQFYYQNLIHVPSGKNEATVFGSAVHYALQCLFEKMQKNADNQFPSQQQFIQDFNWYMQRNREHFTKEQFARRIEYGEEVLSNYYDTHINSFNKIVAIERSIKNVVVKGVPLKGKLDKLEFDGKAVNVVDYKTGDFEKALAKLKAPNEKEPNGGDYWRQAVFYKILVDNYEQKDWKVISTEFDFIEPDKKKAYKKEKLIITPPDIETVTQQITSVWQKIQDRDFYTGCGKEDCHWCNFVKNNQLTVELNDLNEEEI
ncbi:MAG: DNA helicase UvrD [Chitinophaga sp.]|jgi:DNA helicase II / ATP-dependent DNA helicase PcrA|nr:DNA helicase UvrD [Chitinophaga sp.]